MALLSAAISDEEFTTMSKKHYVVWKGLKTGVFDSWAEVKGYIDGQADAQYMGFASKELADEAFKENYTRALMKRSLEKGGKIPENNSQAVIDKPESVNLVSPPTATMVIINKNNVINHSFKYFK